MITSRHHSLVRRFRDAARGETAAAVVDGWHLLHDAAAAGLAVEAVAVEGTPAQAADRALLDRLTGAGTTVSPVSASVLEALSPVRTPSGVTALVTRPASGPIDVTAGAPALVLVAVDMQDPGNVGAAIRAAEAGGATAVILAGDSADPWGWKALRAAMGSTFRLPVHRVPAIDRVWPLLRDARLQVVATAPRGGEPPDRVDLRPPTAILLGGEGPGLTDETIARADVRLTVPMQPPVESLNVAVTAALIVYEARRQRAAPGEA